MISPLIRVCNKSSKDFAGVASIATGSEFIVLFGKMIKNPSFNLDCPRTK